ncbi:MAG: alpha/beta hydrolase family protein [Candidatus Sigynarchaeota archaeon]
MDRFKGGIYKIIVKAARRVVNRKAWVTAAVVIFLSGLACTVVGRFQPDESIPARFEFFTKSRYASEINDFFNRTVVTQAEDAWNKLVENYWVRGYIILPKQPAPPTGFPVAIWMHGFGVNAESQLNYARQLAKNGFLAMAINLPGHGDSSGFWDMCIQELVGIYSAIDWLLDESEYKAMVDPNKVGVSGHSLGGINTARAGIFDNWTNPRTGNPVGTGGRIRASCSIYCWDNLTSMAEILVREQLNVDDIWNHPVVIDMLEQWRWFSNHDPSTMAEETRLRSVSNFINATNIRNFCLITGSDDTFTSVDAQCHIMANATIDATGIPQVNASAVRAAIDASPSSTWEFGNITAGTGRRLTILHGKGHIAEAFSADAANGLVTWFRQAMDVNSTFVAAESISWCVPHFLVMGGSFLMLAGTACATMALFAYLARTKLNPRVLSPPGESTLAELPGTWKQKMTWLHGAIVAGVIGASGLVSFKSITHYWIFDLVIPRFLAAALFIAAATIVLIALAARREKHRPALEDLGLHATLRGSMASLVLPCMAIGACVAVFDVVSWLLQVPMLLPRPLDALTAIDFATLVGIFFLFNAFIEIFFRGILLRDYLAGASLRGRRRRWKATVSSGSFSGLFVGAGFAINILIGFGGVFTQSVVFIPLIFAGLMGLFVVLGIISTYMFQTTRNVCTAALFLAIIVSLAMGGKFFWPYA